MATKKGILKNGEDSVYPQTSADQIVRANGERLEDADGNIKTMEVYSTGEQVVGKWVDNKPIYRQIFTYNDTAQQFSFNFPVTLNIDKIVKFEAYAVSNVGTIIPNGVTMVDGLRFWAYAFPTGISSWDSWYEYSNITAIVEYTKTTD